MMFCQKEEIDHVLDNHKGASDHLSVSRFLFTLNELQGRMLIVSMELKNGTLNKDLLNISK